MVAYPAVLAVVEPTVPPPPLGVDLLPSYGSMALSSSRGTVVLSGGVEALEGWSGLGPTGRKVLLSRPLGLDGAIPNRRRPVVREERKLGGPIHVGAATPKLRAALMQRVLDVLSPLDNSPVTFSVQRGSEVVQATGFAEFAGGGEFQAQAAWDREAVLDIQLVCPDPAFYGPPRSKQVEQATGAAFFPIGPVVLQNSSGFGRDLWLPVGGDRPTPATFTWTGPGQTLRVTSQTTGRTWLLDATAEALSGAQSAVVRTDPRTGLDGTLRVEGPGGASWFKYLTEPGLFPLAPGEDTLLIQVTGQAPGTVVRVDWRPIYEAIP